MDWFPLPIFPEGGLSASVIVTVWVGVFIVCLSNLRLGWVLSGLVIPGYMVPLLIAKPMAAAVTMGEGILTYLIVWFYSEYLSRYTGWSNFFGRDRFFALVLVSVGVRLVADGWLLPEAGEWLVSEYQIAFDYRSNLHSFGLIITALIANNFWKTGLRRSLLPMFVQIGITWLIVRYGLMELTNFNIASLGFMYEDMASSFMATPKAYIILLVTAFIASRLNLFYGWDFSGILIPSLLALTWYEPIKIATTMLEAVVILAIAQVVLNFPMFRNVTMEGARKLLLFFNVSFAYKFVLSWALVLFMPQLKISDWFGFGYLLATLIALKIHDKGILARMTRATLQTSLTGIVVATVIGFVLLLIPDPEFPESIADPALAQQPLRRETRPIADVLYGDKTSFYATSLGRDMTVPLARELDAFSAGVRHLLEYRQERDLQSLAAARALLRAANFDVELVEDTYLLLRERQPQHYWGTYVLRLDTDSRLSIEVPAPVDEAGTFEAGVALFSKFKAGAFASAGAARSANKDGSSDVLINANSIFQAFHREMASRSVLQVRRAKESGSTLFVDGSVPQGVALSVLESMTGRLKVQFSPQSERNLQRLIMTGQFSELWLAPADLSRIQVANRPRTVVRKEQLARDVSAELLTVITPQTVAQPGSGAYRAPSPEELLRMEREVLAPLFDIAARGTGADGASLAPELGAVAGSAETLGMTLRWIADPRGSFLLLNDPRNFRGWVLVRIGASADLAIEVARPLSESGTLETALAAFENLNARAMVIAGAAPDANPDGSADLLLPDNAGSLFSLAHQAALRAMDDRPGAALMIRALNVRPDQSVPREDAVLSFDIVQAGRGALSEPAALLLDGLESMGLSIRLGGGQSDTAGLDALGGPLANYMTQTRNKRFAVLWVSPLARRQLDSEAMQLEGRKFAALGIPVRSSSITAELGRRRFAAERLPEGLQQLAEQYHVSGDIVLLSALQKRVQPMKLERIEDINSRGAYLLMSHGEGSLAAVLALSVRPGEKRRLEMVPGPVPARDATRFVLQRLLWMVPR